MSHASAPGRVNLIGEHTDYNDGFVLPTPIPQRTTVELRLRNDQRVIVWSRELDESAEYQLGEEHRRGSWIDYVMGCTFAVRQAGHAVGGVELRIASDVPVGSGLSSSAALEIAVLRALRTAFSLPIDDVALALMGQRAEVELVGAPVGAMDQLASSLGKLGQALFIDIQSLDVRLVPLPDADLLVVSSGLLHQNATGDYRTRRDECHEATRLLGIRSLRELSEDDLARIATLPSPIDRRARHVITENARVLDTVSAIGCGDLEGVGALFAASHRSMRDDYEVSIPAIDELVAIADADPDVYGARLTGGGFGGSIVGFAQTGTGSAAAKRIAARYQTSTNHSPRILVAGGLRCDPS